MSDCLELTPSREHKKKFIFILTPLPKRVKTKYFSEWETPGAWGNLNPKNT